MELENTTVKQIILSTFDHYFTPAVNYLLYMMVQSAFEFTNLKTP